MKEAIWMEGGENEGSGSAIQLGKREAAREAALTAIEELKDKLEER